VQSTANFPDRRFQHTDADRDSRPQSREKCFFTDHLSGMLDQVMEDGKGLRFQSIPLPSEADTISCRIKLKVRAGHGK
jgi:hypothetical protein